MTINELSAQIAHQTDESVYVVSKILRCLNVRTNSALYKWLRKRILT